jgi:hypothetical protein
MLGRLRVGQPVGCLDHRLRLDEQAWHPRHCGRAARRPTRCRNSAFTCSTGRPWRHTGSAGLQVLAQLAGAEHRSQRGVDGEPRLLDLAPHRASLGEAESSTSPRSSTSSSSSSTRSCSGGSGAAKATNAGVAAASHTRQRSAARSRRLRSARSFACQHVLAGKKTSRATTAPPPRRPAATRCVRSGAQPGRRPRAAAAAPRPRWHRRQRLDRRAPDRRRQAFGQQGARDLELERVEFVRRRQRSCPSMLPAFPADATCCGADRGRCVVPSRASGYTAAIMPRKSTPKAGFATRAIHAGQQPDPTTGAIMTPVYLTVDLRPGGAQQDQGLRLLPHAQPDAHGLEQNLAALEGGRSGWVSPAAWRRSTAC